MKPTAQPNPNTMHRRVVIEREAEKPIYLDVCYCMSKDGSRVYGATAYDNPRFEGWYRNVFPTKSRSSAEAASPLTFLFHLGVTLPEAERVLKEWEAEEWKPTGTSQYQLDTHAANFLQPLPDFNVFKHAKPKTATEEFVDSLTPDEVTDLIERLTVIKRRQAMHDFRMYWPLAMNALKAAGKREIAEQLQLTVNNQVGK